MDYIEYLQKQIEKLKESHLCIGASYNFDLCEDLLLKHKGKLEEIIKNRDIKALEDLNIIDIETYNYNYVLRVDNMTYKLNLRPNGECWAVNQPYQTKEELYDGIFTKIKEYL